jgi:hypothetical protein
MFERVSCALDWKRGAVDGTRTNITHLRLFNYVRAETIVPRRTFIQGADVLQVGMIALIASIDKSTHVENVEYMSGKRKGLGQLALLV